MREAVGPGCGVVASPVDARGIAAEVQTATGVAQPGAARPAPEGVGTPGPAGSVSAGPARPRGSFPTVDRAAVDSVVGGARSRGASPSETVTS
jgi:hypothetical protein